MKLLGFKPIYKPKEKKRQEKKQSIKQKPAEEKKKKAGKRKRASEDEGGNEESEEEKEEAEEDQDTNHAEYEAMEQGPSTAQQTEKITEDNKNIENQLISALAESKSNKPKVETQNPEEPITIGKDYQTTRDVRPETEIRGHTSYLTFARKVSET